MRTRFILLLLMMIPFFVSAQSNNQQINAQRQRWANDWHMRTLAAQSTNKI